MSLHKFFVFLLSGDFLIWWKLPVKPSSQFFAFTLQHFIAEKGIALYFSSFFRQTGRKGRARKLFYVVQPFYFICFKLKGKAARKNFPFRSKPHSYYVCGKRFLWSDDAFGQAEGFKNGLQAVEKKFWMNFHKSACRGRGCQKIWMKMIKKVYALLIVYILQ